jgi:thymidylate synthase (FAD)
MNIVNAGYQILDTIDGESVLRKIERVARVCYKSEGKIGEGTAEKMIRALIKSGHLAMLEHYSFSVLFTVDRGVTHEIVRHRIASFAQESTRYCNYGTKDGGITVIRPCYLEDENSPEYKIWYESCQNASDKYVEMLNAGRIPQEARAILPQSTKADIVVTANLREWRHFFELRAVGTTGKPHPQMREVAIPLLYEINEMIPVVFEDLSLQMTEVIISSKANGGEKIYYNLK